MMLRLLVSHMIGVLACCNIVTVGGQTAATSFCGGGECYKQLRAVTSSSELGSCPPGARTCFAVDNWSLSSLSLIHI